MQRNFTTFPTKKRFSISLSKFCSTDTTVHRDCLLYLKEDVACIIVDGNAAECNTYLNNKKITFLIGLKYTIKHFILGL